MPPHYAGALPAQPSRNANGSGSANAAGQPAHLTPTAMGRWSVSAKQLPPVHQIKALHVYDFDNTLFKTPLPNQKLWNGQTIGFLSNQDAFANGGWWHDLRILAATGGGVDKEEPRAWAGWWNELVVELVQHSSNQTDALCVLLTGRAESTFGELIKRIAASRRLDFDMVSLKPAVGPNGERFTSTMHFKQMFLSRLMETYKDAEEIRVYEDRPKHVKGFRDFMAEYNRKQHGPQASRTPIVAEVIQVADLSTNLDPVTEIAEIYKMITDHNKMVDDNTNGFRGERLEVKKTVFFTGYMIDPADTKRLLTLAQISDSIPSADIKYHANNVVICSRPAPSSILEKVGRMHAKMRWKVTGFASHEKNVWAACLKPVPDGARFHTDNPSPLVVLALRKGLKPMEANKIKNWQPVPLDKAFEFETTVGEKVILRIEPEHPGENAYESLFPNKGTSKRKHEESSGGRYADRGNHRGGFNGLRGSHNSNFGGRGGRGGGGGSNNNIRGSGGGFRGAAKGNRGGARGGQRGGRGRGGGGRHYQSLDDVGTRDFSGGASSAMYDDGPSNGGQQWAGGASFNSNRSGGGGNNNSAGGGSGGGMEQYY